MFDPIRIERESMLLIRNRGQQTNQPAYDRDRPTPSSRRKAVGHHESLSSSGSNQAREGRLVDALAVRGDEGRDTLR